MQVNSINSYQSKKQNFCGQRLFSAKLLNPLTSEGVDCFITQMDKTDLPLVSRMYDCWKNTKYGWEVMDSFFDHFRDKKNTIWSMLNSKFFMVETPQFKGIENKVKAIAEVSVSPKTVTLDFLQSATEMKGKMPYTGAGSCILYAIADLAQKKNKLAVLCVPDIKARMFYSKNGFFRDYKHSGAVWLLSVGNFPSMKDRLASTYSIRPIGNISKIMKEV